MSFRITNHAGFQMSLPNGWTVSVQFGAGNYSRNRHSELTDARRSEFWESKLAEIACFPTDGKGEWYMFDGERTTGADDVKGYVTVAEFLEWLEVFKKLPPVRDQTITLEIADKLG